MGYIRGAIALILLFIVLVIGLLVHAVTWIIGRFSPETCDAVRYGYVHMVVKFLWVIAGGPTTTIGLENVPQDRPVLFVGNHRSMLDVVICLSVIPFPVGFISKIELEKIPLLRMQMRDINCLFLDRKDDRKALKVILRAIELVKGGQSMFIFPEGTRSKEEGKFLPFHAGSFKIATKAKVPVVPVTIVGTGDILEDHFPKIKAAPVVVEFGDPIETASMSRDEQKELPDRVRDLIMETYDRNRRLL
jgi:1-acyl-sn-glycerol-3-phosphate acyltransferase